MPSSSMVKLQYLRFDEDQINEEHDKVMLHVFITEIATFSTDCKTNQVPIRLVIGPGILSP